MWEMGLSEFLLGTRLRGGTRVLMENPNSMDSRSSVVPELSGQTRDVISHADGPRRCRLDPVAINS